jgi:tetratricopeptide (TPR) repeat protein
MKQTISLLILLIASASSFPAEATTSGLDPELAKVKATHDAGELQESLDQVDAYLESNPDSADAHAWKGLVCASLAGESGPFKMVKYGTAANKSFDRALDIDPDNAFAHYGVGVAKLFTPKAFGGDVGAAVEHLNQALERSDSDDFSSQILTFLAIAFSTNDRPDEAKQCLERAVELDPANGAAFDALQNS